MAYPNDVWDIFPLDWHQTMVLGLRLSSCHVDAGYQQKLADGIVTFRSIIHACRHLVVSKQDLTAEAICSDEVLKNECYKCLSIAAIKSWTEAYHFSDHFKYKSRRRKSVGFLGLHFMPFLAKNTRWRGGGRFVESHRCPQNWYTLHSKCKMVIFD